MNAPKLRFSEFNDEYKFYKFSEVIELSRGSSPRPIINFITKNNDGINWIKIGDVNENDTYINSTKEKINIEGSKKSRRVYKGDIILSNSMSFGRPYILNIDGCIHDGWFVIRNYEKYLDKNYLYQFMSSPIIQHQYKKLSAGGVVSNISSDLVYSVNINIPTKEEQVKVSNLLSLLDKKIELQSKKIEDLKLYKKYNRKNLLSAISAKKKIIDLLNYEQPSNYIVNSDDYSDNKTLIPVLTANKAFILGYCNENNYYNKGDCIIFDDFTMDSKYVTFNFKIKSSAIKILTPKEDVNLKYIFECVQELKLESVEHKRHYISIVQEIMVPVPSVASQNKIANLLTEFDKKIELENNKLSKLQKLKKGLMQNMFV